MMVLFVSECEKKALTRTRRVLDAFANRIGQRTWLTVITEEGLQAVKTLLRKTASKNTAVACHWLRSRSRCDLLWVVGNQEVFDIQGCVAVNYTQEMNNYDDSMHHWHYLPLIKSLATLAALFHDWGKASEYFQTKLKSETKISDPLRHEWISQLFFHAYVNGDSDEDWLVRLLKGEFDVDALKQQASQNTLSPLGELPNAASLLSWLIVSHHRLPAQITGERKAKDFKRLFEKIRPAWGYENADNKAELKRCFAYPNGLPSDSADWVAACKKQAARLLEQLPVLEQALQNGSWRLILLHSRLALMLGDHYYSSLKIDDDKRVTTRALPLFANTDRTTHQLKQTLDEHLLGVAKYANNAAIALPKIALMNPEADWVHDNKKLRESSPKAFAWQDKAVKKIQAWRNEQGKLNHFNFGFFAVNMASTGKGKTFANAKIMRALSPDSDSLRFILALGLRTLTLQTGNEYRRRIGLNNEELAVLIGSRAILSLHAQQEKQQQALEETGSESEESLLDNELDFVLDAEDDWLATVLKTNKDRQFLYAPVLSCTIDHLMAATDTSRGGRYILPTLRLMSSDLVIDEIDDFTGNDLIAIGRLIHLAGMLGRKVMISSATIPPDLAEGYYYAYQAGWSIYAAAHQQSKLIGCAWIDEFNTELASLESCKDEQNTEDYRKEHQAFARKRSEALQKQPAKRKANIVPCSPLLAQQAKLSTADYFAQVIQTAILEKHQQHGIRDEQTGKQVSFGVVRVANIKPCIHLTRQLLNATWPEGTEVRIMAYHSQQVLIMRHAQESHLDEVLQRNQPEHTLNHRHIRAHLAQISQTNVIFILIATPVEEVGRDHDFDWAVVEPSSYRSLIQLAGRVLRHRELETELQHGNIAVLQHNLKGLQGNNIAFNRPGYESEDNRLSSKDLLQLLDTQALSERLDASPRINKPEKLAPKQSLIDLEHHCTHQWLTNYSEKHCATLAGWISSCWWLTGDPQYEVQLRQSDNQLTLFLIDRDGQWRFSEKHPSGVWVNQEVTYGIKHDEALTELETQRLWLHRDYATELANAPIDELARAAKVYGEANFPVYDKDANNLKFSYSSQFGFCEG